MLYQNSYSTLIPQPLFDENHKNLYLGFNQPFKENSRIVFDELKNNEAVNIYYLPNLVIEKAKDSGLLIKTIQELVNVHSSLNIDVEDMDVVDFVVSEGILVLGLVQVRNKRIKKISTEILNEFAFKSWNDIIMYLFKMKKNARKVLVTEEFFHYISSPPPSNIIRKSLEEHEMLLNIAKRNAKAALQSYLRTTKATVDYEKTLEQMQEILKLPKIPHIINGFDISTLKGLNSTGSCVVFIDGVPVKKFYRKFRSGRARHT